MSQGTVGAGPRLVYFTGDRNGPAGTSAHEALMIIAPQFLGHGARSSRILEQYPDRAGLDATVYGLVDSREILVVGQNRLSGQLREVLGAGEVPGWRLRDLPAEQTPIDALYARLSARAANLLRQGSFVSAQEIAALPDEVLLEIRGLGQGALAEIRSALADPSLHEFTVALTSPTDDPASHDPDPAGEGFAARLRPELRYRYRDFLRGLAAADLPPASINRILDSLAAEPVPPDDPVVGDILVAAGALDLLAYYQNTHEVPHRSHQGW